MRFLAPGIFEGILCAEHEFKKLKMVDPIWRPRFLKINQINWPYCVRNLTFLHLREDL